MYEKEYILKLLRKENLTKTNDLTKIVSVLREKHNFSFISEDNLNLDSEKRIYQDKLEFKDSVINIEKIMIANSSSVKFYNCIVRGNIIILDKNPHTHLEEIVIDSCVFLNDFIVTSAKRIDNISIYRTNFDNLRFSNFSADTVNIVHSRIFDFDLNEFKANTFYTSKNLINNFIVSGGSFNKIDFDYNQINLKNVLKNFDQKYRKTKKQSLRDFLIPIDYSIDNVPSYVQTESINQTINFIKSHTNIYRDKKRLSNLSLFESVYHQNNRFAKILMWVCGGFVRPFRFLIYGALLWFLFTFFYYGGGFVFKIGSVIRSLNFGEALYFSGITLTTIGYGDISPIGLSRILVVIEGAIGITILSCFVVSLVRRFIGDQQ